jgi:hypothetical protein
MKTAVEKLVRFTLARSERFVFISLCEGRSEFLCVDYVVVKTRPSGDPCEPEPHAEVEFYGYRCSRNGVRFTPYMSRHVDGDDANAERFLKLAIEA